MSDNIESRDEGQHDDSIFAGGGTEEAPVAVPIALAKSEGAKAFREMADHAEQEALEATAEKFRLEAEGADAALVKKADANRRAKTAEARLLKKKAEAQEKKARASRNGLRAVPDDQTAVDDLRPVISLDDEPAAVDGITSFLQSDRGPDVYLRGTEVVTVVRKDEGKTLMPVEATMLTRILSDEARVIRTVGESDGMPIVRNCLVPQYMAATVLANRSWELPVVRGITTAPLLRRDGSFTTAPGYDGGTGYFHAPRNEVEVPETVTPEQVEEAKKFIVESLLGDFPWQARSDKASFLAAMFIPLLRAMTNSPTMMWILTATGAGSGKSELTKILEKLYGYDELGWASSDTEMAKKVTAVLASGSSPIARCDNVPNGHKIGHASISRVITSEEWSDRILGASKNAKLPNGRLWIFNGNNIRVADDNARRAVWVRLHSQDERPEDRDPDSFALGDMGIWLDDPDNVARLLGYLLTLLRGWVQDDTPRSKDRIASFGPWPSMLGGILQWMGVEGWLEDRESQMRDEDDTAHEWEAFLNAWFETFGTDLKKVSDVQVPVDTEAGRLLTECLPTDGDGDVMSAKKLGGLLGKNMGRKFGPELYEIQRVRDSRTRSWRYRVVRNEKKAAEIAEAERVAQVEAALTLKRQEPVQQQFGPTAVSWDDIPGLLTAEELEEQRAQQGWAEYRQALKNGQSDSIA